jgi:hypothetical protein
VLGQGAGAEAVAVLVGMGEGEAAGKRYSGVSESSFLAQIAEGPQRVP